MSARLLRVASSLSLPALVSGRTCLAKASSMSRGSSPLPYAPLWTALTKLRMHVSTRDSSDLAFLACLSNALVYASASVESLSAPSAARSLASSSTSFQRRVVHVRCAYGGTSTLVYARLLSSAPSSTGSKSGAHWSRVAASSASSAASSSACCSSALATLLGDTPSAPSGTQISFGFSGGHLRLRGRETPAMTPLHVCLSSRGSPLMYASMASQTSVSRGRPGPGMERWDERGRVGVSPSSRS
mmetsp:Transcript_82618/g.164814  ORF Transcript_82618/g.164814 Transcript_82618/m.164814 type:complete len:244 (-) Transcript_82618:302-1033(-)